MRFVKEHSIFKENSFFIHNLFAKPLSPDFDNLRFLVRDIRKILAKAPFALRINCCLSKD